MNTLKHISNDELISRIEKLVRSERKITHLVLLHIAEIERRKIFAELGFDGMYAYLTKGLGYSDGAAYRRLQSARLLNQIPEIAEKIEEGKLNLSQLTQVQKCLKEEIKNSGEAFTKEKTLRVLEKLENMNSFQTQKTLACEMNLPIVAHEKVSPQRDDSVRLEITFTQEQFTELERAKSLLSHICPDGGWAEVISALAKQLNQKKLVGRNTVKPTSEEAPTPRVVAAAKSSKTKRRYISVIAKRALLNRAQHQCEFVDSKTGQQCQSQYQLEIDHVHPLALGGGDQFDNLRVLCRTHNAFAAREAGLANRASYPLSQ